MSRRKGLAVLVAALSVGCGKDGGNPFEQFSASRPPGADAVLLFVSGSWADARGGPRELFALNADGSAVERLTTCTQASQPCDLLRVSPSPSRTRVVAVRTTPGAEPGTAGLYFMDLERSVETIIVEQRRASGVDWSLDGGFLVYSAADQMGNEDLYSVRPNGDQDNALTTTPAVRERSPRLSPFGNSAVYEHISDEARGAVGVLFSDLSVGLFTAGGTGEPLPGTPYVVGSDADPAFSPQGQRLVFRRLTALGNGGLGTWDIFSIESSDEEPTVVVSGGSVFRGAPDWGPDGIVFVETDAAGGESRLVVVQPDGSARRVLRVEHAGYGMASPRWLR